MLGGVTPLLNLTTFDRISRELRSLGFRCATLDLEGFRSGNLNVLVPLETLRTNAG